MARLDRKSIVITADYRSKDWQEDEQRQLEAAAKRAKAESPGDTVGELLRWGRADGYAMYMVTCEQPLRVAHVDIGDAYSVEGSLIRGLRLATVRAMVESDRAAHRHVEEARAVYDEFDLGQIVHYHNGFGQFVRCEVVDAPDDDACMHAKKGERCLKELALVGNWREYDLRSDSYHMQGCLEGRLFKPHSSNIYENPKAALHHHPDPRKLAALALQGQQELFG